MSPKFKREEERFSWLKNVGHEDQIWSVQTIEAVIIKAVRK
jgi:hypothetical protein